MPIYEHECGRHGVFEALRAMSEASLAAPCPVCRDPSRRIVSAPRIMVLDNREARINQGTLIPFAQVSARGPGHLAIEHLEAAIDATYDGLLGRLSN